MKIFVVLLFASFSLIGYGQQHPGSDPAREGQPLYFLDSVNIGFSQLHFDPNKLLSVNVVKNHPDSSGRIRGAIFMTSKDPKSYTFISMADLLNRHQQGLQKPTIFMLDDEFLKDTATFKIDASFVLKVEITNASAFEYFKNTIPDLTIFKIITRTKENIDRYERIRIRGTQSTAIK